VLPIVGCGNATPRFSTPRTGVGITSPVGRTFTGLVYSPSCNRFTGLLYWWWTAFHLLTRSPGDTCTGLHLTVTTTGRAIYHHSSLVAARCCQPPPLHLGPGHCYPHPYALPRLYRVSCAPRTATCACTPHTAIPPPAYHPSVFTYPYLDLGHTFIPHGDGRFGFCYIHRPHYLTTVPTHTCWDGNTWTYCQHFLDRRTDALHRRPEQRRWDMLLPWQFVLTYISFVYPTRFYHPTTS